MASRDISVSVYFARAVLKHAVSRGLDPIALLRKTRISPRLLLENDARISAERFADLQVNTMLAMEDEALGYASRPMPLGCWSMMCHAVMGCETLGQAMARYCRFYQLFEYGVNPSLLVTGESVRLRVINVDKTLAADPYMIELLLFNAHRYFSWLVQEHLPLQQVELAYAPAAQLTDYRAMFLGNPVAFEQDHSQLVLSPALLDKRITQTEQSLRHFLRHPVLIMLTQSYNQNSWTARVRELVHQNLVDMPELNDVANMLEVHPQTLRRRLSAEGATFKEIKSQVRRDTALHFLGKQGLSIEEIAHRAGFSESSAFIRAFKGWTGVTPYTYRKGL
ncbi:helix-turn-helix domain-containing protein [Seongchinamella sediminis]|uniref:Helix-turn-helix domain-containing protein n=1 Tax=Seongchinamella sediminis TaxID=2283635 RepID=A0A3L7DVM8_9GAMM|nr:AraC family transcriptional regulator [Seongchinamella sediminis]RLQ21617.1 helix-turn-helix domain-containing protein [Seongchinamella sediminis]